MIARAPWFVIGGSLAGLASGLLHGVSAGGALVGALAGWLAWALAEHDGDDGEGEPVELGEPAGSPRVRLLPGEG
jgi:hypothetical protein